MMRGIAQPDPATVMRTDVTRNPGCNPAAPITKRLPATAASAWLFVASLSAAADPDDASSREFSVFAGSLAMAPVTDASSREFSLFAGSLAPVAVRDAVTREFSVLAGGAPGVPARDAVAREFSVLVLTPPVITLDPSSLNYREGDAPLQIDATASVANPDSNNFGGGFLRGEFVSGEAPGDLLVILEIPGHPITVDPGGEVRHEDVPIGSFSGGEEGAPLMVMLNGDASIEATQALARSIAYANDVRYPDAGAREVGLTLADALVGEGPTATREILVDPVNHDPVPGDDTLGVARNTPQVFAVARLLANDIDPDGDTALDVAFPDATTARGGTIGISGGMVTYTPPPDFTGTDQFSYTLSDPFGGIGTGKVKAYVRAPDDPSVTVLEMGLTDGGFALALVGLPDRSYQGFASEDLVVWAPFAMETSDEIGALHFLNPGALDFPLHFYRFSLSDPAPPTPE